MILFRDRRHRPLQSPFRGWVELAGVREEVAKSGRKSEIGIRHQGELRFDGAGGHHLGKAADMIVMGVGDDEQGDVKGAAQTPGLPPTGRGSSHSHPGL